MKRPYCTYKSYRRRNFDYPPLKYLYRRIDVIYQVPAIVIKYILLFGRHSRLKITGLKIPSRLLRFPHLYRKILSTMNEDLPCISLLRTPSSFSYGERRKKSPQGNNNDIRRRYVATPFRYFFERIPDCGVFEYNEERLFFNKILRPRSVDMCMGNVLART